jgi:hypothetical protein
VGRSVYFEGNGSYEGPFNTAGDDRVCLRWVPVRSSPRCLVALAGKAV